MTCLLLAIAQSGSLVARFSRSAAFPLLRSPPPSLRSGTSPQGGFNMPFWRSRSVGSNSESYVWLRRAALHFGVVGWQTRCARPATQQPLRYAAALLRQASLSPCPLLRSVKKRCLALLRRAKRFLCGVGYAVRCALREL